MQIRLQLQLAQVQNNFQGKITVGNCILKLFQPMIQGYLADYVYHKILCQKMEYQGVS